MEVEIRAIFPRMANHRKKSTVAENVALDMIGGQLVRF